jgi:uncharacterized ion transporter superfamily protein YfcC
MIISTQLFIILGVGICILAVTAIFLLDLRFRRHGQLSIKVPFPTQVIIAGAVGIIFSILFFYEIRAPWFIAIIFLLIYVLGFVWLIRHIKSNPNSSLNTNTVSPIQENQPQKQSQKRSLWKYLFKWFLFLLAFSVIVYTMVWLAWRPTNSDPALVTGYIIAYACGWLYMLYAIVRLFIGLAIKLSKRD